MSRAKPAVAANPLAGLLGDIRLLLILFVAFRLLLLIVYQPLVISGVERGLAAGGDLPYYHALAALTADGLLPFRDWWSEFPPIPAYLMTAVYALSGGSYPAFAMLFGVLMLAFDAGNLVLLHRLGARLHGSVAGLSLAWVYALLLAPAVFIWWNFEPLVAFCFLLALWWLVRRRDTRSAVVAAVGGLVKFTPLVLLGAAWRFRARGPALRYTAVALGLVGLVYAFLLVQNAAMTVPSLTAQFNKASYQTVWALLDGNYRTGNFGSVASHLDPAAAADLLGNPPVVPGLVRLVLAAGVGLFVFARTRRFDARGLVAFAAITLLIFFLQSQGWSPQWLVQIIPLILLCFPTRTGVLIVLMLSAAAFVEYPMLFLRTGDTGGEIAGPLVPAFVLLVVLRTAVLVGVCVALYRILRGQPVPDDDV